MSDERLSRNLLIRHNPAMPNGGGDNCSNCRLNLVRQSAGTETEYQVRLSLKSHCSLRDVPIPDAYFTYCRDFTSCHSTEPLSPKTPTGPIFAGGSYERGVGYVRIPWFGIIAPAFELPVECCVCGRSVPDGIELRIPEGTFGFLDQRSLHRLVEAAARRPDGQLVGSVDAGNCLDGVGGRE